MTATTRPEFVPLQITSDINVAGEIVAPGLAVTPSVGPDGYTGYWRLMHVHADRTTRFGDLGSIDIDDMRRIARTLIDTGHNWDVPAGQLPAEAVATAAKALNDLYREAQEEQQIQDHEMPFVLPAAAFDQPPPRD